MIHKCYVCGNSYDGWKCPTCEVVRVTKEQTKVQQRALERAKEQQQSELTENLKKQEAMARQQLREQGKMHAESWKLEAQNKLARAKELYHLDMPEEAFQLCINAISLDPSHLPAYELMCQLYVHFGDVAKAHEYWDKQAKLLKLPDYDYQVRLHLNTAIFGILLNHPRVEEMVHHALQHWCEMLENYSYFKETEKTQSLIPGTELIDIFNSPVSERSMWRYDCADRLKLSYEIMDELQYFAENPKISQTLSQKLALMLQPVMHSWETKIMENIQKRSTGQAKSDWEDSKGWIRFGALAAGAGLWYRTPKPLLIWWKTTGYGYGWMIVSAIILTWVTLSILVYGWCKFWSHKHMLNRYLKGKKLLLQLSQTVETDVVPK